jgi:phospholipase C
MRKNLRYGLGGSFALLSLTLLTGCGSDENENIRDGRIRHLIVVSGENRSFDNVFATYTPPDSTQAIWNLRSRGIIPEFIEA